MKHTAWIALGASLLLAGCHTDMYVQPKKNPQTTSDFFLDGLSERPRIEGTVRFEQPRTGSPFETGYENGRLVEEFPIPVTAELIARGQERYGIFCTHCHGNVGNGQGMIAQRGFTLARPIPTYHTDRLREMPVGHFFDVITNGFGTMYQFADRIPEEDRWAIAAYIRVLQVSQDADPEMVSGADRIRLQELTYGDRYRTDQQPATAGYEANAGRTEGRS